MDVLCEVQFLFAYHVVSDCAEIKQAEQVDLDELMVVKLLKSVLKLRLLGAQIGPQRVFELSLELVQRFPILLVRAKLLDCVFRFLCYRH